jgi:hypothetical protein
MNFFISVFRACKLLKGPPWQISLNRLKFAWHNPLVHTSASSRIQVDGRFHAEGYVHFAPNVEISVEKMVNYILEGKTIYLRAQESLLVLVSGCTSGKVRQLTECVP